MREVTQAKVHLPWPLHIYVHMGQGTKCDNKNMALPFYVLTKNEYHIAGSELELQQ